MKCINFNGKGPLSLIAERRDATPRADQGFHRIASAGTGDAIGVSAYSSKPAGRRTDLAMARSLLRFEGEREAVMLWTVAVLLLVLWALGLVTSYTMGGLIHILLVVAVIVVVVRLIQGRRIT
jgi:Flp pilus assembly protein TadB